MPLFQNDPNWRNLIQFHEYFHGDDGHGVGASHQTGWSAMVIKMIDQLKPDKILSIHAPLGFLDYDGPGDGRRALTPTEFMQDLSSGETKLIERREKRFALMDSDANGTVDVIEYIGFGSTVMELLDADSDGYIRRAEFTQAVATPE